MSIGCISSAHDPDLPVWAPIDVWTKLSGIGRRVTYEWIAAQKLPAKKSGKRTLVHVATGLKHIESLPSANIRLSPRQRRKMEEATAKEPRS